MQWTVAQVQARCRPASPRWWVVRKHCKMPHRLLRWPRILSSTLCSLNLITYPHLRMFLQFSDYQRAGNDVMQGLFLFGEAGHDVTDSDGHYGNPAGKITAGGAAETDPASCQIRDLQPQCFFPKSSLPRRAFQERVVQPGQDEDDQKNFFHTGEQWKHFFGRHGLVMSQDFAQTHGCREGKRENRAGHL